ncbi:MAG: trypsin-like peptidase domain-containing protein [Chitinophagaceae bacterium]|jgi:Do/DeqQ family serine protease|nr:trypsin-like peptidase domain-containing protein [Chitinophagaceae bacterium]
MNFKNFLAVVGISAATAVGSVWGVAKWHEHQNIGTQDLAKLPVNYAGFFEKAKEADANSLDFTAAATSATPAVVHIKVKTNARKITNNNQRQSPFGDNDPFGGLFDDFFGGPRGQRSIPEQRASGSGVLISDDGYIVTNNHVVSKADEITVTLANRKTYTAKVIGTDPNSDLAVIKIEGKNFPYLVYGNSDDAKLGQWVLAIGYPLDLNVTVTAGIVSAKARGIGISQGNAPVDSYIQTDAAVNPGNSGGALVNTNGELIGINAALASPTGSYAGYSFAIPVNIVKKVVSDLLKYGAVQRGYIGIQYMPDAAASDDEIRKKAGVKEGEGVFVTGVPDDGAAKAAGIKKGDFVTKINGRILAGASDLSGTLAGFKPGDKVNVTYVREGKENTVSVTLQNKPGNLDIAKDAMTDVLGADFATINDATAQRVNIRGGVQAKNLKQNGALKRAGVKEGFIIAYINGKPVMNVDELKKELMNSSGAIELRGFYSDDNNLYGYRLNLQGNSDDSNNNGDDDGQ